MNGQTDRNRGVGVAGGYTERMRRACRDVMFIDIWPGHRGLVQLTHGD